VPDRGGECEESLENACADAGSGSSAVAFEVELGFEGLVDRFDDLTERSQEPLVRSWVSLPKVGRMSVMPASASFGLEADASVALVAHQDLTGTVQFGVRGRSCPARCRVRRSWRRRVRRRRAARTGW